MDDTEEVPEHNEQLPTEQVSAEEIADTQQDTAQLGPVEHTGEALSTPVQGTAANPLAGGPLDQSERAVASQNPEYTPLVGLPLGPGASAGPAPDRFGAGGAPTSPASPGAPGGGFGPGGVGPGGVGPGGVGPGGLGAPSGRTPGRGWRVAVGVAAAVVLAGGLGAGLGAAFATSPTANTATNPQLPPASTPTTPAGQPPSKVSEVANRVERALVNINTNVTTEQGEGQLEAAGTGMILSSNGVVLTNNHVVENATSIKVTVAGHSGEYPAKVLGTDVTQDVAVIKIEGLSNLPHITLANSASVRVGDQVIAIGNAGGLGGKQTVVTGAITGTDRSITASDDDGDLPEHLSGLIETDADIVPGDSGGSLVDYAGQVVGMDTAAEDEDTGVVIGFAIPIDTAYSIAQQIEQGKGSSIITIGLSSYLGIYEGAQYGNGNDFGGFGGFGGNSGSSTVTGVEIGGIVANSPAAAAGLQAGDVITSVNGQSITSWTGLTQAIAKNQPGQKITIGYVGEAGTSSSVTVTLGGIPR